MIVRWIGPGFWLLLALNGSGLFVAVALGNLEAAANFIKGGLVALACLVGWEWLR